MYYFDIDDGGTLTRDEDGAEMTDLAEVRRAAIAVLPDIARDELPDSDRRVFSVRVRDQAGNYVFYASLSLVADWLHSPKRTER